jgi:hypothetical protein
MLLLIIKTTINKSMVVWLVEKQPGCREKFLRDVGSPTPTGLATPQPDIIVMDYKRPRPDYARL